MSALKIKVDRIHIAGAIKGDAYHCMIANAIREKLPAVRWVLADAQTIRWTDRAAGKRYKYLTPPVAQQALLKFDRGEPVAPFSVALLSPIVRDIHPKTRRGPNKGSKAKNKKKPNTARYKHKKSAPEYSAIRIFGLRGVAS